MKKSVVILESFLQNSAIEMLNEFAFCCKNDQNIML